MNADNKKQVIVAAVLGVVLVSVLVYQFFIAGGPPPAPKAAKRPTQTAASTPAAGTAVQPTRLKMVDVDIDTLLKEIKVVNFDYAAEKIDRDPMTPLVGSLMQTGKEAPLVQPTAIQVLQKKVTGILYDPYAPVAVVDDEVVGLGHTYPNGVQVYTIEADQVVFKVGDSLIPVKLKEL